MKNNHLVCK